MQLQKTTLAGVFAGIIELSVLTNAEYLVVALEASQEDDGYVCILGTNIIDPTDLKEDSPVASQQYDAVVIQGHLVNSRLT